jgi:hypothetical protein
VQTCRDKEESQPVPLHIKRTNIDMKNLSLFYLSEKDSFMNPAIILIFEVDVRITHSAIKYDYGFNYLV